MSEDILVADSPDPARDPAWRISMATIESDVPFSRFDGTDRLLMPIGPTGLRLDVDAQTRSVPQFGVVAFPGEANVATKGVSKPEQDLNVMVDRRRATATLTHHYVVGTSAPPVAAPGEIAIAVALSSTLRHNGELLTVGDALLLESSSTDSLGGFGTIAVARIKPLAE
ncbi:environmental stress-induced protein Ves [Leifsonia sp. EB41]